MKALVKAKAERGIWLDDIPMPAIGHNDVLVKVRRSAICGTDIHIFKWDDWARKTVPVPLAIGHEFCGEVVECGSEVSGFHPGDRVSAEGHITCGVCRNCRAGRRHLCISTIGVGVNRQGAFAEYISIPAFNVFKLVPEISDDMASILDPLGNATHTAMIERLQRAPAAFGLQRRDAIVLHAHLGETPAQWRLQQRRLPVVG
jgi:threonine 3-dehydrogenase